jgi:hypothetical protein
MALTSFTSTLSVIQILSIGMATTSASASLNSDFTAVTRDITTPFGKVPLQMGNSQAPEGIAKYSYPGLLDCNKAIQVILEL